jgi:hypothetical protein
VDVQKENIVLFLDRIPVMAPLSSVFRFRGGRLPFAATRDDFNAVRRAWAN